MLGAEMSGPMMIFVALVGMLFPRVGFVLLFWFGIFALVTSTVIH